MSEKFLDSVEFSQELLFDFYQNVLSHIVTKLSVFDIKYIQWYLLFSPFL